MLQMKSCLLGSIIFSVKKTRATDAFFADTEDVSYLDPSIFLIQDGFAQNIIPI